MPTELTITPIRFISFKYDQESGEHRLVLDAGDGQRVYTAHQAPGTEFEIWMSDPEHVVGASAKAWRSINKKLIALLKTYKRPGITFGVEQFNNFSGEEVKAVSYFSHRLDQAVAIQASINVTS